MMLRSGKNKIQFAALLIPGIPRFVKILIGGVVLAVIALLIALLTQRIGELKSGELDDLDQY